MEAYSSFAAVYDLFMDNVPYDAWASYVIEQMRGEQIADGIVLDLGCGTGKMTRLLADAGYDMIGVDGSEEMLSIAREEEYKKDRHILYLLQDMREFELYGTVRAVVSCCDSLNYITDDADLLQVFRLVNNYLDPGGLFLFDLNTVYKYRTVLGECTISENRDEGSFIWDNLFDEESGINEYDLTLYLKAEGDLYRRYEEVHYQRAYELSYIRNLLEQAGMEFLAAYDAYTRDPVSKESERVTILAREHGKGITL